MVVVFMVGKEEVFGESQMACDSSTWVFQIYWGTTFTRSMGNTILEVKDVCERPQEVIL